VPERTPTDTTDLLLPLALVKTCWREQKTGDFRSLTNTPIHIARRFKPRVVLLDLRHTAVGAAP